MKQSNITRHGVALPLLPSRSVVTVSFVWICLAWLWCGMSTVAQAQETKQRKVIVCSTTQVADFARQVVGDRWKVLCVLGPGEDPHTYRPTTEDSLSVAKADLCLENGWHLEGNEWMKELAKDAGKPLVTCVVGVQPIDFDENGKSVNDPHAWLSPKNAWIYTKNILNAISQLDPDNKTEYEQRAELFRFQLRTLDKWTAKQVNAIPEARRVLITHHDAFGYFCKEYKFKAISPVGWTTSELAGLNLKKRQEIVDQIRELKVKSIFVESSASSETLDGIAKDAGVEIGGKLYSDAMGPRDSAGETYLGMMRENVLTIVQALK